jgi:hypothetical protein
MALPNPNLWTNFLALAEVLDMDDLYETRIENDSNGKILYVGMTMQAGAATDEKIWYIFKLSYDVNGFLDYKQLPVDGPGFIYAWDLRATYF